MSTAGALGIDTFVRANQSGFGTSSDGQSWTKTGAGTLSIASNEGVIISNGADTHIQLGTHTSADMEVCCRITTGAANGNDTCGIQGRFSVSGSNTTCYKLLHYGGAIHLNKAVSGANSQLTSVSFTLTAGTYYWFRLRITGTSGTNLWGKIWQDGTAEPATWTTTTSDTAVTGSGGFAILANTDNTSTGIKFDHFLAVDSPTSEANDSTETLSLVAVESIAESTVEDTTLSLMAVESITDTTVESTTLSFVAIESIADVTASAETLAVQPVVSLADIAASAETLSIVLILAMIDKSDSVESIAVLLLAINLLHITWKTRAMNIVWRTRQ